MAGSIRFLQLVRKFHQLIGIYPPQLNQNQHSINSTQKIFVICCAQFVCSLIAFLVFEAKFMLDYGNAFYALISMANSISIYSIFIWQSENTLKFIENCNGFIETSMY